MKKTGLLKFIAAGIIAAGISFTSCKSKSKTDTTNQDTTTTVQNTNTAPVEISTDDSLTTGLKDATKDYPGVNATINNGEVTLTGTIKRDRLPALMQSIHALHPKKVNNNLTIQ